MNPVTTVLLGLLTLGVGLAVGLMALLGLSNRVYGDLGEAEQVDNPLVDS